MSLMSTLNENFVHKNVKARFSVNCSATTGCGSDTLRIMKHVSMTTRDVDVKRYISNNSN